MRPTQSPRPLSIQRVRRRLERWRRTRVHLRAPIPKSIWAGAVALARQHGLYQTAQALPINYGVLKRHLEEADRPVGGGTRARFVELRPTHPTAYGTCVIEVDGPQTMVRVRVEGVGLPDLARLSRAIAGVDA